MAFRVLNVGRPRSAPDGDGGAYIVGGKRRGSYTDSDYDKFDFKRKKFASEEYRLDEHGLASIQGEYGYTRGNCCGFPPNGLPIRHRPGVAAGAGDSFNYPKVDDYYRHGNEHDIDAAPIPHHHFPPREPEPLANRAFYVIRERSPTPDFSPFSPLSVEPGPASGKDSVLAQPGLGAPLPGASAMERTQSGLSISSDNTQSSLANLWPGDDENSFLNDDEAARLVRDHVAGLAPRRRRRSDSRHGRILKALINPKSRGDTPDWALDNDALRSIFSAANELFFDNKLTGRVAWDWSHPASAQYQAHIVGSTAVRRSRQEGYETLIVLSSPILQDTKYNRRLLISTFLHEMIHSYLFVMCGPKAAEEGGHTAGFRKIAETIDNWVGRGYLRLGEMEADLEQFREHENERYNDSSTMDSEWRMRGTSPWRSWTDHAERERDDYYPIQPRPSWSAPPQRQSQRQQVQYPGNNDECLWHEREGFYGRGA